MDFWTVFWPCLSAFWTICLFITIPIAIGVLWKAAFGEMNDRNLASDMFFLLVLPPFGIGYILRAKIFS